MPSLHSLNLIYKYLALSTLLLSLIFSSSVAMASSSSQKDCQLIFANPTSPSGGRNTVSSSAEVESESAGQTLEKKTGFFSGKIRGSLQTIKSWLSQFVSSGRSHGTGQETSQETSEEDLQNPQQQNSPKNTMETRSDYRVHNNDTDQSSGGEAIKKEVAILFREPGVKYFESTIYEKFNPETGDALIGNDDIGPRAAVLPPSESQGLYLLEVNATENSPVGKGYPISVPTGYEVVGSEPTFPVHVRGGHVTAGQALNLGAMGKVYLKKISPLVGATGQDPIGSETTLEKSFGFDRWPEWLKEKIVELKKRQDSGESDYSIAKDLASFLRSSMKYRVDANDMQGVEQLVNSQLCQCDGAAGIAVTILVGDLGVSTQLVSGFTANADKENPGSSVILRPGPGHMWLKVFDSLSGLWKVVDPTPNVKDRETSDEAEKSDRFSEINDSESENSDDEKSSEEQSQQEDGPESESSQNQEDPDQTQEEQDNRPSSRPQPGQGSSVNDIEPVLEAWYNTLASFAGASEFELNLQTFLNYIDSESGNGPENKKLSRLRETAQFLSSEMTAMSLDYKNLNELAELIEENSYFNSDKGLLFRLVQWVNVLITSAYELDEGHAYFQLRQLLRKFSAPAVGDENHSLSFAKNFIDSLQERPLEQEYILTTYPEALTNPSMAQKLISDMSAQKLWRVYLRELLADHIQLRTLSNPFKTPQRSSLHEVRTPRDRFKFGRVREFENPQTFVQDGTPVDQLVLRATTGDLQRFRYFEERHQPVAQPEGKVLTVILFDTSYSMINDDAGFISDQARLVYLEYVASLAENDQFKVIMTPYNEKVLRSKEIDNTRQAISYFDKMNEEGYPVAWGNNTEHALKTTFRKVERLKDDYDQVNVVLITDGEEDLSAQKIIESWRALNSDVDLSFSAITLVEGNESISELVSSLNDAGIESDEVTHVHFSASEISDMIEEAKAMSARNSVGANSFDWGEWSLSEKDLANLTRQIRRLPPLGSN